MNGIVQNPLTAPLLEIPDPPEEFGQDGGKFYRCYDALADEIDDDMVKGLKEQLDGMLIFAGLFAGVNTAFLALTIPLLSPDPADDTNALLSRNNDILIQLLMRNDSVPASSPLPSTSFSPSSDIFTINALFALSLAFAIISSFLAVLGRQWLVYYRKRSGGGPDHQRWEQLKRFLGAKRWRLQAILDDVLPSLLQIGLVIFCVSLVLYLRHLNRAISRIVAIPMYVGLAFFVGSALCTVWDKFGPFHSPLSHMLLSLRPAIRAVQGFNWRELISAVANKRWFYSLIHGRREESPDTLQIITLKRAICTSDDPATLLYATSNIIGIKKRTQMEQLWNDSDRALQERFLDQYRNSYARMLQLRGRDQVGIAMAARRLYCGAAAHILLVLDSNSRSSSCLGAVQIALEPFTSIALGGHRMPPSYLVRATLGLPTPRFDGDHLLDTVANDLQWYLVTYSSAFNPTHPDWRLFHVITWVAINLRMIIKIKYSPQGSPQQTHGGSNLESIIQTLGEALAILTGPEREELGDCDGVLMIMLHGIRQVIVDQVHPSITLQHRFALMEICERILHSPRLPETARRMIRDIRLDIAQVWQGELESRATSSRHRIPVWLVDMLERYITGLRMIYPADSGYDEYNEVLQAFGPPMRELLSYGPNAWANKAGFRTRFAFRETFDTFLLNIDNMAHQAQETVLQTARDPDERLLHSQENTADLRTRYSLPADEPDSPWHKVQEHLEKDGSTA